MKYLFYNCQLLLLCCACCKFAIQAFVHEDRHAIQPALAKNCQFYRRVYRRTYTRQYFTESCKQNYDLLPQLPMGILTAVYPSVFHKELQKKLQPFATITDGYIDGRIPVGISQRVANKASFFHNYRRVYRRTYTRQYFTESCKTITAFCHNYRRVYRRTCHNYRCIYRRFLQRMAHNPKCTPARIYQRFCRRTRKKQCAHVLAHNFRRILKNMEGFSKFLLENQLNTDGNYRRNLMPPPKKLLLYVPSAIPTEILCYKTLPPPLLDSFLLGSSFHLLFSSPCVLSFCKSFYCCVGSFQHI